VGVCGLRGSIVFATERAVSLLRDDVVLPLAVGIGGPLHAYQGGILVHDQRSARLFVLNGSAVATGR